MTKLKLIIIFLIIVVIILASIMVIINLNKQEITDSETDISTISKNDEQELQKVLDNSSYFMIKVCIQKYLNTTTRESKSEAIYNMLSNNYISENKINKLNAYKYVDIFEENVVFVPLNIKQMSQSGQINNYIVYGLIENEEKFELKKEAYFLINIDKGDLYFSIEPLKEDKNIDKINITKYEDKIEKNANNSFKYPTITNEIMANEYLNLYKRIAIAKQETIYEYLDSEYREKRFPTINDFKEYVVQNRDNIKNLILLKYKVTQTDNYTQYDIIDQNENYYIFRGDSILNFKVMLDNYTIYTPEMKKQYLSASDEDKVNSNISKIFKMINNKQYKTIYEKYIQENFKNNYFAEYSKFENYMKQHFFDYNYLGKISIEKSEGYYIVKVPYKSGVSIAAEESTQVFFIRLEEETDFKLSFDMQ